MECNLFFRSQYFDQDGHLAHEFYEQTIDSRTKKIHMKKCSRQQLIPQVFNLNINVLNYMISNTKMNALNDITLKCQHSVTWVYNKLQTYF